MVVPMYVCRYGIMKKCWTIDTKDRPGMNIIIRDMKRLIRDDSETPVSTPCVV